MSLPASLKSRYFIDGFYSPIKLFNSQEISKVNSEYQKYVKKFGKDGVLEGDYRFRVHLLARWAHDLVTHPLLVAAVKTVLDTNNILCWSSDICRKPAHSRGIISWHQDSAYSGLEPSDAVVTAWVALSPSTRDTGAVVMWPGSQERTLQHAREGGHPDNQLVLGQFIPDTELAQLEHQGAGQEACLAAGEVSLHSWRCVHSSGPNTTDTDRVGLAIRYSTAVQRSTVQYSSPSGTCPPRCRTSRRWCGSAPRWCAATAASGGIWRRRPRRTSGLRSWSRTGRVSTGRRRTICMDKILKSTNEF